MPIVASNSGGGNFTPAPEGIHSAVCVDILDLGILPITFQGETKMQHKVRIFWQIDEERADGNPHEVMNEYTLSLNEKAKLRQHLETWRGRKFTEQELEGFDIEVLLGKPCQLQIMHVKSK